MIVQSPESNITKSNDDSVKNTEDRIKRNIGDLNNDEIKARMKIYQEFKGKSDVMVYKYFFYRFKVTGVSYFNMGNKNIQKRSTNKDK